jgi:hypothetical protein
VTAIGVDGKTYMAHRLAFLWMTGDWPTMFVDHINGNRSDNRWSNLTAKNRHARYGAKIFPPDEFDMIPLLNDPLDLGLVRLRKRLEK